MKHLETLNIDQRRAVEYGIIARSTEQQAAIHSGPLLIIAGAGSGKTTVLASRVTHLIVNGADPHRILLLTFSRRAALEMERRVESFAALAFFDKTSALASASRPAAGFKIGWSGTFHAVGARLLRIFAARIGIAPNFTIHDREDAADLMNMIRHDLGLSEKKKRFPLKSTCLGIYSMTINAGLDLEQLLKRQFPWCAEFEDDLRGLFDAYVKAKQEQNILDYDDLLLYWAEMMKADEVAGSVRELFDHILVDEYQDTNPLQGDILSGLAPTGQGLTAVGDDAQSIYGFRGATVRNILDFPARYSPPAAVVTLTQNYRSTQPILCASNAVIALAKERFTKDLFSNRHSAQKACLTTVADDIAQATFVAERVLANRETGISLKSQAVLFRTSHHSNVLEIELTRRNIPFVKFGGLKFLDSAHVKDIISVLRWAQNPRDRVTAFRVFQLMPGIGPSTAAKMFERMISAQAPFAALTMVRPPSAAAEGWQPFVSLLEQLHGSTFGWPADIEAVRNWFQPYFEAKYPDASVRAGDLDQLVQIASHYRSREHFLTSLALDPPDATSDEAGMPLLDEDYLILSTIHSAKGQEWKSVYILNVVDGCIPSDMATGTSAELEEERRLLYVAMTRAKDELHLIIPQKFYVQQQARSGDRHLFATRTRFIPSAIVDKFEQRAWPIARRTPSETTPSTSPPLVDLKVRLGNMWKAGV